VISCGPWHFCNHEAGRLLSRRLEVPFIMDLRDPWSLERRVAEAIASPAWFALARRHERRAVEAASLVITNAEPVRRAMAGRYPGLSKRFLTITNGYDEEPVPRTRLGTRFVIAYAGGIYLDRDPRPVFRAAKCVVEALDLTPEQFGIELIGNVDTYGGVPIDQMAEEEGLGGFVSTGPARPRSEALEFLSRAAMLMSLPQDSPWAIPSKIFEYMQFDAWMLVLAEPDAPAALLLHGTGANVASPGDVDAIAAAIRARYAEFASGARPVRIGIDERFSRRYQAERLMDAMARCISPEGAASGSSEEKSGRRGAGLTRMEARC
jgi:glycosyltransferase involved in cell wall biosynthesis